MATSIPFHPLELVSFVAISGSGSSSLWTFIYGGVPRICEIGRLGNGDGMRRE